MNKIKQQLLLLIFLLFHLGNALYAQEEPRIKNTFREFILNPDILVPESSSLKQFALEDKMVDLYTGKINFNIPLASTSVKEFSLPITLKYYSGGIKVKDIASSVGLGWQLDYSGATLTRELKGNPDEHHTCGRFINLVTNMGERNGEVKEVYYKGLTIDDWIRLLRNDEIYNDENSQFYPDEDKYNIEEHFAKNLISNNEDNIYCVWGNADTEPDIFHFTLPSGHGRFILDSSGQPKVISGMADAKIVPAIGPKANTTNEWKITDTDGNVYVFPNQEDYYDITNLRTPSFYASVANAAYTKEEFLDQPYNPGGFYYENANLEYVNAWYCKDIKINGNSNNLITYEYTQNDKIETFYNAEERRFYYSTEYRQWDGSDYSEYHLENNYTVFDQPLEDIYDFVNPADYQNDIWYNPIYRKVVKPNRIKTIILPYGRINFGYSEIERLDLESNYALNEITIQDYSENVFQRILFNYDYFQNDDYSRLKLVSVNLNGELYNFQYDDLLLPSYDSKSIDFWGFFNQKENSELAPSINYRGVLKTWANRNPDEIATKANLLKSVVLPTGGKYEFYFEQNDFVNDQGLELPIGGVRVNQIDLRGTNNELIESKSFNYDITGKSSGRIANLTDNWSQFFKRTHSFIDLRDGSRTYGKFNYVHVNSESFYELHQTKSGTVGYGKVSVIHNDNSKKEYSFSTSDDFKDIESNRIITSLREEITRSRPPEFLSTSLDEKRGKLKLVNEYNNQGYLVKSTELTYSYEPKSYTQPTEFGLRFTYIPDFYFWTTSQYTSGWIVPYEESTYGFETYSIRAFFPKISKKTETYYNNNVKHKLTKNYLYDSENHFQLTSNEILVNDELKVKEEFVYSSDLFFLEDIDLGGNTIQVKRYYIPKDKNRIGRPVQYLKIKNNQVVAANFNKWESIEGYYAPTKNYRLNGTIAYNDFVKPVYNDNQLQIDNRFELKEEKTLNEYFSVTESIDGHGIKYQYSWGYKESEIIAKVSNTENGFFFTSFEDVNDSWNAPQSEMSDLAKTGSKSIKPLNVLEVLEPLSAGQYYVEVYLKSTNGSTSETVTIDNINGETPINVDDEIEVDSEWTYNKIPITVDEATQLVFNSTGNILFDELRIYPVDAQMESYTYEPLVGMTSMNDANGRITYFEYDEAGRLKLKRDHEGNILEAFEYNYVNK